MSGHTYIRYYNPRCAHAHRGLIMTSSMPFSSSVSVNLDLFIMKLLLYYSH